MYKMVYYFNLCNIMLFRICTKFVIVGVASLQRYLSVLGDK